MAMFELNLPRPTEVDTAICPENCLGYGGKFIVYRIGDFVARVSTYGVQQNSIEELIGVKPQLFPAPKETRWANIYRQHGVNIGQTMARCGKGVLLHKYQHGEVLLPSNELHPNERYNESVVNNIEGNMEFLRKLDSMPAASYQHLMLQLLYATCINIACDVQPSNIVARNNTFYLIDSQPNHAKGAPGSLGSDKTDYEPFVKNGLDALIVNLFPRQEKRILRHEENRQELYLTHQIFKKLFYAAKTMGCTLRHNFRSHDGIDLIKFEENYPDLLPAPLEDNHFGVKSYFGFFHIGGLITYITRDDDEVWAGLAQKEVEQAYQDGPHDGECFSRGYHDWSKKLAIELKAVHDATVRKIWNDPMGTAEQLARQIHAMDKKAADLAWHQRFSERVQQRQQQGGLVVL